MEMAELHRKTELSVYHLNQLKDLNKKMENERIIDDVNLKVDPRKPYFRFVVLLFTCFMSYGNYYFFDMPSVLQDEFENPRVCPSNSTNCTEGLGMSPQQYNMLYAIYSWTNAVVVLYSGMFIDKYGNLISLMLFSSSCVIGSILFAFGSTLENSDLMNIFMLIGRLMFGAGDGSVTIVQYRICSDWFKNKELAFAFSMKLVVSRLGSTTNFFLTNKISQVIGTSNALWFGAGLCLCGFLSALCASYLDRRGTKVMQRLRNSIRTSTSESLSENSLQSSTSGCGMDNLKNLMNLPLLFWITTFSIVFFYNALFPFVADASKFVMDVYGYGDQKSSMIAGSIYDVSLLIMPFMGALVDYYGFRGFICSFSQILTIPIFVLLAFQSALDPLVLLILYGITYSVTAPVLWACIPLVVKPSQLGFAMGITSCLQMLGIGSSNMIVGAILGRNSGNFSSNSAKWEPVILYFLGNTVLCTISCTSLLLYDLCVGNCRLNHGKRHLIRISRSYSRVSDVPRYNDIAQQRQFSNEKTCDLLIHPKRVNSMNTKCHHNNSDAKKIYGSTSSEEEYDVPLIN